MNDPQTTIDDFASRLTDLSLLTPLHTHHALTADTTYPSKTLPLPRLLHTILTSISQKSLPLDPTLPILHTPRTVPLKRLRPSADASALPADLVESFVTLPDQTTATDTTEDEHPLLTQHPPPAIPRLLPHDDPFPAYLSLQIHHLKRVVHYNYTTLEITPSRTLTHATANFLSELGELLSDAASFRARFGSDIRSAETVALLAGHKPARETVVPLGRCVIVHTRTSGKMCAANAGRVKKIVGNVRCGEAVRHRGVSLMLVWAWLVCLGVVGVLAGAIVWVLKGGLVITALAVLQLVVMALILVAGVGREFRTCLGVLLGWRLWVGEGDVVRDCGRDGRDALVNGLFGGGEVDDVVSGFGFGRGVGIKEWTYDPRFGVFVGERCAFAVRGRRWFRVVREKGDGGFRLFEGGRKRPFVGVPVGVRVVDGGKKLEVV